MALQKVVKFCLVALIVCLFLASGCLNILRSALTPENASTVNSTGVPVENPKPNYDASEMEQTIHILINLERGKSNLQALGHDELLADMARDHSKDMMDNNYFNTTDSNGDSPSNRAGIAKYSCRHDYGDWYTQGIGEDIYWTYTYYDTTTYDGKDYHTWNTTNEIAHSVVNGWMSSPANKDFLLSNLSEKEGVGVYILNDKVLVTRDVC